VKLALKTLYKFKIHSNHVVAVIALLFFIFVFLFSTKKSDNNPLGIASVYALIINSIIFSFIGLFYIKEFKAIYPRLKNIYDLMWVIISIITLIFIYNKSNDLYITSSINLKEQNIKKDLTEIHKASRKWLAKIEKDNLICIDNDIACISTISALKTCPLSSEDNCIRVNTPYSAPFYNKSISRSNYTTINSAVDEMFKLIKEARDSQDSKNSLEAYERSRLFSYNQMSVFGFIYPFIFSIALGLRISKAIDDVL
jgi:hypothetical protein